MRASLVALLALVLIAPPALPSVLISELCDPRDNYPTDRFIEIYNSGTDPVDLTNWSLVAVANGVNAYTWPLSGLIQPGDALVAGNATTVTVFTVDFPGAWSAANGNWNGRIGDGARLINGAGTVVDLVVATGTLFENMDLVRKPSITEPNPVYTPGEWTAALVTLATDASPGTHVVLPPPSGPAISHLVTDPAVPVATDAVDVQADVVDTTAAIATVALLWGTAPDALTNTIPMALVSAPTYATTAPVPAHPEGTTVYYKVQATNVTPVTAYSSTASYFLAHTATIHQVQGEAASSPYDGTSVITRGVVTAHLGSYFVIQDGAGPWSGLWARGNLAPAVGDSVAVQGQITESDAQGMSGTTLLANAVVLGTWPGATLPPSTGITSALGGSEAYEGVLATVAGASCTDVQLGGGVWQIDDGSGPLAVDPTGYAYTPTLGTTYDVTGPIGFASGRFRVHPRGAADVVLVADLAAPVVIAVAEMGDSTFLVTFSEPVDAGSAQVPANYHIAGIAGSAAARDATDPAQVWLTLAGVPAASVTLTVTGVADLNGNATAGASWVFPYIDTRIPPGYYASALGLRGTQLRSALHEIIRNHTVVSYDGAWTAYRTTDWKPNGMVWDVYSDIPGGTAPYEYTFDQTGGIGGKEGTGYTREHTWPKSWFGGEVSPMYSDLWIIYPCDTHVNGLRGVNPYGDVAVPSFTFLNGSRLGSSADAGYTGTVFEPIDAFKGDLARSYFYVATRYYGEDATWPGGPATSGADLLPWANETYVRWSLADSVSQKEILRNGAIYALQHNRNPFIDHPEFVRLLFDSLATAAVGDERAVAFGLRPIAPNPFRTRALVSFDLPSRSPVELQIFDVAGRLVRTLVRPTVMEPGRHEAVWDGRGGDGSAAGAGLYFCRLRAGALVSSRRLVLVR